MSNALTGWPTPHLPASGDDTRSSTEVATTFDGFARAELEAFFSRREERGKFYCGTCLARHLTRRGARKIAADAWIAAIEEAFLRPGRLQVRSGGPCESCETAGSCIGMEPLDTELDDQELMGR